MDEKYMRRCFELARKGLGMTGTNPLVGCVIVHGERIIGEGYHRVFGGPHAEVIAIRSVGDQELLKEATLYCNLEPCAHQGKTPPCSMLIIRKGIPRVVVSNTDPFPSVDGKGVSQLKEADRQVVTGCLGREGFHLNRRFFTYHQRKRPYVILKWAQTIDRFIDLVRGPEDTVGTNWITDEVSRTLVHKWRAEESAVMVGTNTVITDNPMLNNRRWSGGQPVRVVLDRNGRIPATAHVFDGSLETIVFKNGPGSFSGKITPVEADPSVDLPDVLQELFEQKILSVFVEGGAELHRSFIQSGLWDEARVFTGTMSFGQGVKAPELARKPDETLFFRDTMLEIFHNS